MRREMRGLLPIEAIAVVAAAVIPLPIPSVVPLLVVASVSLWLRGRSWLDVARVRGIYVVVGAAAGAVALGWAIVGSPAVERLTDEAVQWSSYPVVRSNASTLALVATVVAAAGVASELVLRGWIVERVVDLGGHRVLAALTGGIAEALVAEGGASARLGAGLFGIALGGIYLAAGRSVVAPICARLAFSLGALLLEAMRVIG